MINSWVVFLHRQEKHYWILTYDNYKRTAVLLANDKAGRQTKSKVDYHQDDMFTDMWSHPIPSTVASFKWM